MNALALLCELIAQGGKASAAFYRDNPDFAALLRHGYLREAGVVSSVVCNDCDEAHATPVVFEDGRYGHYCPESGFVPLERVSLRAILPEVPMLIDRLADALECKRRRASPLFSRTWRIGLVDAETGSVMLYFHPHMRGEDDARDLDRALSREVRSDWRLIVTAKGNMPLAGAQSVRLDDLFELKTETGRLHLLAHPAELVGIPRKNKGGRPSDHRAPLAAIILERIQTGAAIDAVNAESKAILTAFRARHPGMPAPSLSTVKRHLAKSRGGS